jgi:uncharacterized protein YgfB (UPF0149 family)
MTDDANTKPEFKIVFSPGAFDDFEGTQAELDEIVLEVTKQIQSGELFDSSTELTADDWEELPEHVQQVLIAAFEEIEQSESDQPKRMLH